MKYPTFSCGKLNYYQLCCAGMLLIEVPFGFLLQIHKGILVNRTSHDTITSTDRIYVRKSKESSFWKKNLEIKTLVKTSQFSEVLGQNVTGNKVLGNKITGIKVLKKIYPKKKNKKKVQSLVKMRPSLRRLHKRDILCIFILNIARDVLNINRPCFCMVVNILCSHAFFTMIELFFESRSSINHTGLEPEKKSLISITV